MSIFCLIITKNSNASLWVNRNALYAANKWNKRITNFSYSINVTLFEFLFSRYNVLIDCQWNMLWCEIRATALKANTIGDICRYILVITLPQRFLLQLHKWNCLKVVSHKENLKRILCDTIVDFWKIISLSRQIKTKKNWCNLEGPPVFEKIFLRHFLGLQLKVLNTKMRKCAMQIEQN